MWETITAAVTGIFAIALACITSKLKNTTKKLNQAKEEIQFSRAGMDFGGFLEEWEETHEAMKMLLDNTAVDRILILRAWNGELNPKWTTAVFQMRQGEQEPISYVHFELDIDYVNRVREITTRKTAYYKVSEMPSDAAIRAIYENEGVTGSMWAHLDERNGENNTKAITYCSFATHAPEGLTEKEQTQCRILAGRMKGLAGSFYG